MPRLKARQVGNQVQVSGFKDFDQMTRLIEFIRSKGISPTKVLRLFDRVGSIIVNLKDYDNTISVRNLLSNNLQIGVRTTSENVAAGKRSQAFSHGRMDLELEEIVESDGEVGST